MARRGQSCDRDTLTPGPGHGRCARHLREAAGGGSGAVLLQPRLPRL